MLQILDVWLIDILRILSTLGLLIDLLDKTNCLFCIVTEGLLYLLQSLVHGIKLSLKKKKLVYMHTKR